MAKIKTTHEIELLRESGKRLAGVLQALRLAVKPGMTTRELDTLAEALIRTGGDVPPFLHYTPWGAPYPYPASLCISVNDEIVHGIPGDRVIRDGDIIGLDLGVSHQGLITDSAITVMVGTVSPEVKKLVQKTEEALMAGIAAARGRKSTALSRRWVDMVWGTPSTRNPMFPTSARRGQGRF
jgi:methionyl aminopeptidase